MSLTGFNITETLFNWLEQETSGDILELGSGLGTNLLLQHYSNVYSIEHNIKYIGLTDSNYIYAPIKNYGSYRWYDVNYLKHKLRYFDYSVLLIDGPTGDIGRAGILEHLDLFDLKRKTIVIDDTHRKAERQLAFKLMDIIGKKTLIELTTSDKSSIILE